MDYCAVELYGETFYAPDIKLQRKVKIYKYNEDDNISLISLKDFNVSREDSLTFMSDIYDDRDIIKVMSEKEGKVVYAFRNLEYFLASLMVDELVNIDLDLYGKLKKAGMISIGLEDKIPTLSENDDIVDLTNYMQHIMPRYGVIVPKEVDEYLFKMDMGLGDLKVVNGVNHPRKLELNRLNLEYITKAEVFVDRIRFIDTLNNIVYESKEVVEDIINLVCYGETHSNLLCLALKAGIIEEGVHWDAGTFIKIYNHNRAKSVPFFTNTNRKTIEVRGELIEKIRAKLPKESLYDSRKAIFSGTGALCIQHGNQNLSSLPNDKILEVEVMTNEGRRRIQDIMFGEVTYILIDENYDDMKIYLDNGEMLEVEDAVTLFKELLNPYAEFDKEDLDAMQRLGLIPNVDEGLGEPPMYHFLNDYNRIDLFETVKESIREWGTLPVNPRIYK